MTHIMGEKLSPEGQEFEFNPHDNEESDETPDAEKSQKKISRRDILKGGLAFAASVLMPEKLKAAGGLEDAELKKRKN